MTTLAMAGAVIGGSLLTPSVAMASPTAATPEPALHDPELALHDPADAPTRHALPDPDDDGRDARPARNKAEPATRRDGRHRAEPRHTRPMTSGERQFRNNCRQGLMTEHCELVDTEHLLQRGINPGL